MALAKTRPQKERHAIETPERVRSVRNAPNTSSHAVAAAVSPDKPLTDRQKAFAIARARGESVPNAMAEAGYNEQPSYGYRLDKMPNVQALIRQEAAKYADAANMTRKKVVDMQLEAFEMARLMAEPASMVAAAREVGKICGLYEPQKVEVTGTVKHELQRFGQLDDTELLKIIMSGDTSSLSLPPPEGAEPETDDEPE